MVLLTIQMVTEDSYGYKHIQSMTHISVLV